jgi:hypothetical protein
MRALFLGIGLITALLCSISYAHGQRATERYIPIGQSPGISNKYTYIGVVEAVDPQQRTVTAAGHTVQITDETRIWLDRSLQKLSNERGGFDDLQKGRKVEIKYADAVQPQVAQWVKVQVTAP